MDADQRLLKFALKLIDEAAEDCEELELDEEAERLTELMNMLVSSSRQES
jgi:hypothetical protein